MKSLLHWLKVHPLVTWSLIIAIIDSPLTLYSGIFLGKEWWVPGLLLYSVSMLLGVIETIIYWKLILSKE